MAANLPLDSMEKLPNWWFLAPKHTGEELTLRDCASDLKVKHTTKLDQSYLVTLVILIFPCSVGVQIIVINFLKFIYTASTKPTIRGIQFLYMALCESGKLGSLIITCATFDQSSLLTRRKAIPRAQRIWTLLAKPWGVPSRRLGLIKYWSFISHQRQNIERIRENENHDQFHCDITWYSVDSICGSSVLRLQCMLPSTRHGSIWGATVYFLHDKTRRGRSILTN